MDVGFERVENLGDQLALAPPIPVIAKLIVGLIGLLYLLRMFVPGRF